MGGKARAPTRTTKCSYQEDSGCGNGEGDDTESKQIIARPGAKVGYDTSTTYHNNGIVSAPHHHVDATLFANTIVHALILYETCDSLSSRCQHRTTRLLFRQEGSVWCGAPCGTFSISSRSKPAAAPARPSSTPAATCPPAVICCEAGEAIGSPSHRASGPCRRAVVEFTVPTARARATGGRDDVG